MDQLFSNKLIKEPRKADNIEFRALEITDFEKGFSELLQQLTEAKFEKSKFLERFIQMKNQPDTYYIIVAEDITTNRICATGCLFVEKKFIRSCGTCAHIEDIVVDSRYRGKNLGLKVIEHLKHIGNTLGCYKLILDCDEKNVKFYEKCGFERKGVQLSCYNTTIIPKAKL
ncbi:hypothetical protein CYY_000499 [Polysphondylium violaceum]|uniref:Glucosamine 6-phosphate N-acetyltransferase n=1 Tax=Polysphondylium violaceum TaxID=133409 RepID=A0A8J4VBI0_9MYCE|nr:hypothetical protein CYY_000499 [Polysphondylium violaceum]